MAIGDAVTAFLGTAVENRQPSSGVEEKIRAIGKDDVTDPLNMYDGTTALVIVAADAAVLAITTNSTDVNFPPYDMHLMINNSVYLRKSGTTNNIWVGGVQTNS
jgi:hypothetical protein